MVKSLECTRELIVQKSAQEVWKYISDVRNSMTSNQFHMSVDCTEEEAMSPEVGKEYPILHVYLDGSQFYRIARVMKYDEENFEIAWSEAPPADADYEDSFPHGEGFKVEPRGPNECLLKTSLYGSFRLPLGQMVGDIAWDLAIPSVLDNDLQDVAYAVGAIPEPKRIEIPRMAASWLRLANAREIDGIPAEKFLDLPERHGKSRRSSREQVAEAL